MASSEHEPFNGGLGGAPMQRGTEAEPLIRGPGAKTTDADSFLAFERQ